MAEHGDYGGARPKVRPGVPGPLRPAGDMLPNKPPEQSGTRTRSFSAPPDDLSGLRDYRRTVQPPKPPRLGGLRARSGTDPTSHMRDSVPVDPLAQLRIAPSAAPQSARRERDEAVCGGTRPPLSFEDDIFPPQSEFQDLQPSVHPPVIRRSGSDRRQRDERVRLSAFQPDDPSLRPLSYLETRTSGDYDDVADQEADLQQQEEEEDRERTRIRSCDSPPQKPQRQRKVKVRPCDFCRKEYLAVSVGSTPIEEYPPGCPVRVCAGCAYKHPDKLTGIVREGEPGWYLRLPGRVDAEAEVERPQRPPSKIVRDLLAKYPDLSQRGKYQADETADDYFYPPQRTQRQQIPQMQLRPRVDLFVPDDPTYHQSAKHIMGDCYMTGASSRSKLRPCTTHKRGDPGCWLSKGFRNAPEEAYKRYWSIYKRPESSLTLDRKGMVKKQSPSSIYKKIYRPRLLRFRDPDIRRIVEENEDEDEDEDEEEEDEYDYDAEHPFEDDPDVW